MSSPDHLQLPPIPAIVRPLTNDQSAALNARIPAAHLTVAACVTCHGKKVFTWRDDQGNPAVYDCPCADQYLLARWLMNSGIMLNYARLGWSDLIHLSDDTIAGVMDYFEHREAYISAGIGLILHGETRGTGKTMLAMLLLKQMLAEGIGVYATTFSDMIDSFASGWQEREQSRWFSRTVRSAPVLYIDDLGRERNKGIGSVGENMLETVTRSRVASNQPTIITTNYSPEDIHKGYGGHTMSLISERSMMVEVKGKDLRPEVRQRTLDEVRQGLTRPVVLR